MLNSHPFGSHADTHILEVGVLAGSHGGRRSDAEVLVTGVLADNPPGSRTGTGILGIGVVEGIRSGSCSLYWGTGARDAGR